MVVAAMSMTEVASVWAAASGAVLMTVQSAMVEAMRTQVRLLLSAV
jgi:hypothetical protein